MVAQHIDHGIECRERVSEPFTDGLAAVAVVADALETLDQRDRCQWFCVRVQGQGLDLRGALAVARGIGVRIRALQVEDQGSGKPSSQPNTSTASALHNWPASIAQDFMVRPSEAWCPRLCAAMAN